MSSPHTLSDPRDMELIDEYLEHLRRAGRTEATIHGRREILTRLNSALDFGVGQTDDAELARWLYNDGWALNTRYTYFMALRSFYAWAAGGSDPWLSHDPTTGMEPVKMVRGLPRPVTDDQLRRILTEAAEPIRTWALLAAYEGLRSIEIARLDREHVTAETLIVVKGKGGRPRVHDTHPDVWARVRDLPPGPVGTTKEPPQTRRSEVALVVPGVDGRWRQAFGTTIGPSSGRTCRQQTAFSLPSAARPSWVT